ncbi:hypothetical protein AGMMS49975_17640 [Clostridia bacterium]|nr:hypothetical protein AGMMS49975_17640 [Clostridia bacterium]
MKKFVALAIAGLFAVSLAAMYGGASYVREKNAGEELKKTEITLKESEEKPEETEEVFGASLPPIVLSESAKITYKYKYNSDDKTIETTEKLPYFLAGLGREQIAKIYENWKISDFSATSLVLSRTVDEASEKYIVGVKDGYIAVFYDDAQKQDNVMEVTDIPVASLTSDEQIRLGRGIRIKGEKELAEILQDYGS